MTISLKLALVATFGLALALTISCSMDSLTNTLKEMDKLSSNEKGGSSSSGEDGDNKPDNPGCTYDTPVTYQGETYKTIKIGDQIWMARNLNYNVNGSKCYNNNPANCATYGRLYDWATAMALPASCNSDNCSTATITEPKHQGICPPGWHTPGVGDRTTLINYVENDNGCYNCAGKYLKATSGWTGNGNGTDKYCFAALPGGTYGGNDVGEIAHWWTDRGYFDEDLNPTRAFCVFAAFDDDQLVGGMTDPKTSLLSVRCVKD